MPLILDTFNILHVTGVLPPDLAGIEIKGLLNLIARSRYSQESGILVCDGMPHRTALRGQRGQFRIVYSGPMKSADDQIRELIVQSTATRQILMVSSDRAVQRHARKRRCRVLDSETFLRQLADDAEGPTRAAKSEPRPGELNAQQVEAWANLFGMEGADLDQLDPELPDHLRKKATEPKRDPDQPEKFLPRTSKPSPDRNAPILPDSVIEEAQRMLGETDDHAEDTTNDQ